MPKNRLFINVTFTYLCIGEILYKISGPDVPYPMSDFAHEVQKHDILYTL